MSLPKNTDNINEIFNDLNLNNFYPVDKKLLLYLLNFLKEVPNEKRVLLKRNNILFNVLGFDPVADYEVDIYGQIGIKKILKSIGIYTIKIKKGQYTHVNLPVVRQILSKHTFLLNYGIEVNKLNEKELLDLVYKISKGSWVNRETKYINNVLMGLLSGFPLCSVLTWSYIENNYPQNKILNIYEKFFQTILETATDENMKKDRMYAYFIENIDNKTIKEREKQKKLILSQHLDINKEKELYNKLSGYQLILGNMCQLYHKNDLIARKNLIRLYYYFYKKIIENK